MKHDVIVGQKYHDLQVVKIQPGVGITCICICGAVKMVRTSYDLKQGRIKRCNSCKSKGSNNSMYGKKHKNKKIFRKYSDHPLINYDDYVLDSNNIKKYYMLCGDCNIPKGYRRIDSIDRPCFACAMRKNLKYTDIQRRLRSAAKSRLNSRLRRKKIGKSTGIHFKDFPFTLDQLILHLESKFKDGMSWDNYGQWHIDHIRPDSSFEYSSCSDDSFKQCWSLSNLQPLWKKDNLIKGAKYVR